MIAGRSNSNAITLQALLEARDCVAEPRKDDHRLGLRFPTRAFGLAGLASLGAAALAHAQVTVSGNDQGFGIGSTSRGNAMCVAIGGSGSFNATTTCSAVDALAVGNGALASSRAAIALGTHNYATGEFSVAISDAARASQAMAIAVGRNAIASGASAVAMGYNAQAIGAGDLALGEAAYANGTSSNLAAVAVGLRANAAGQDALALGNSAAAAADYAAALGNFSSATARNAVAVGNSTSAGGVAATAMGNFADASGQNSVAIGSGGQPGAFIGAKAAGVGAVAIGGNLTRAASAPAADAIALAGESSAAATSGIAIGRGATVASAAAYGIAHGDGAMARQANDIAIGRNASTSAASTGSNIAIGAGVMTGGNGQSVAIGSGTTSADAGGAAGGAVAIGRDQRAIGNGAVALGDPNTANGDGAVALGAGNVAAGDASGTAAASGAVAIGNGNQAIGQGAVAVGNGSTAAAVGALAFGDAAQAQAARGIAVGSGATAANADDVALGAGSRTAAAIGTSGVTIRGTSYTFAGTAPGSTVSVGDVGAERTVTNVAAGRVSGTSTDAVNGSQLFAANQAIEGVGLKLDMLGGSVASVFGGSSIYDPATGRVTGGFTYAGNSYTTVQNVFDQIDRAVSGGGIRYFHVNSTLADSAAAGTDSVAVGPVAVAQNINDVAMGNGATTAGGQSGDVALGAGSRTAAAIGTSGVTIHGTSYTFAGTAPGSTVSVGDVGAERTVTNVAAGRISGTSTDAVNGSQLFAANQAIEGVGLKLDMLGGSVASVFGGSSSYDPATGRVTGGFTYAGNSYTTVQNVFDHIDRAVSGGGIRYFHANSTLADSAAAGTDSIAIGPAAVASATDAISMGKGAVASGEGALATGSGATASGAGAMAIGRNAQAADPNAVALGSNSKTAAAVATTSTIIDGRTYQFSGTAPVGTVSVGDVGFERTVTNLAAGRISATSTDAVNGSQLFATNQAVGNLSSAVGQVARNAVQYDTNPDGSRKNSVTLVGGDPGAPVVIANVAAGRGPTDAVNVGQLNAGLATSLSQSIAYADQVAGDTLGQANAYTDAKYASLNGSLKRVRREARQAAAVGLAAASLRFDDRPGKLSAAVGGGMWRGEAATSFGLGYTSENRWIRANVSATTTGAHWGISAGFSLTLN